MALSGPSVATLPSGRLTLRISPFAVTWSARLRSKAREERIAGADGTNPMRPPITRFRRVSPSFSRRSALRRWVRTLPLAPWTLATRAQCAHARRCAHARPAPSRSQPDCGVILQADDEIDRFIREPILILPGLAHSYPFDRRRPQVDHRAYPYLYKRAASNFTQQTN